ncbi:MAG: hypothetical protein ACI8TE_001404 [Francisella sp.]|jgi:hypothetical protein
MEFKVDSLSYKLRVGAMYDDDKNITWYLYDKNTKGYILSHTNNATLHIKSFEYTIIFSF